MSIYASARARTQKSTHTEGPYTCSTGEKGRHLGAKLTLQRDSTDSPPFPVASRALLQASTTRPLLFRAREASQSQPPFRKPTPFILPGILRPLPFSPSFSTFSPFSLTVEALSYTTRLDPTIPAPARHFVHQPTTPTYRSDPRAISKIIPYILELGMVSSSSSVEDRAAVGRRENMGRTCCCYYCCYEGTTGWRLGMRVDAPGYR